MDKEGYDAWTWLLEEPYLIHSPDEPEDWIRPNYLIRTAEEDKAIPRRTADEELDLINEQIKSSWGFDIDFSMFRCLFNYHPLDFEASDIVDEPETNKDLLSELSKKSLDNYNQENKTEFEFVKPLYANFHLAAGVMLLITFEAKDRVHNSIKKFQARVRYSFADVTKTNFVFCRPKPEPGDADSLGASTDEDSIGVLTNEDSIGVAERDVKKPRLE